MICAVWWEGVHRVDARLEAQVRRAGGVMLGGLSGIEARGPDGEVVSLSVSYVRTPSVSELRSSLRDEPDGDRALAIPPSDLRISRSTRDGVARELVRLRRSSAQRDRSTRRRRR